MDYLCNRRVFLKSSGLALVSLSSASLGAPLFLQRAAQAAPGPAPFFRRKCLVCIFQRGAMDSLMAVPPLGDPRLKQLRPSLAMSAARSADERQRVLDLGVNFGLHPAFGALLPLWKEKRLGIVHALGSPNPTRSHFDAQDYMETGTPGNKGMVSGWLNRVMGELGHDATVFRGVSMTAAMPRSLAGPEPALAIRDLSDFALHVPGNPALDRAAGNGFEALYDRTTSKVLRKTAEDTFDAIEMLRRADLSSYRPAAGADYPNSPLGDSLRQIAFLVKGGLGLEVAFAESGGWDTHVRQDQTFRRRADDLARAIAAFWTDLGTYQDDVVLMTMTEFGRTAAENGSAGTDHGHASCMFVLGNHVAGGKVHGRFPGLRPEALYEGRDLAVTTDFRSVFAGVAQAHLGVPPDADLFPGWKGPRLGVMRS